MGLNIKNQEVERLATEVARMTNESKTEAIRKALSERKERLQSEQGPSRKARLDQALEKVWAQVPPDLLGKGITKEEREEILGIGPNGCCD